jgi:hypothetical protein
MDRHKKPVPGPVLSTLSLPHVVGSFPPNSFPTPVTAVLVRRGCPWWTCSPLSQKPVCGWVSGVSSHACLSRSLLSTTDVAQETRLGANHDNVATRDLFHSILRPMPSPGVDCPWICQTVSVSCWDVAHLAMRLPIVEAKRKAPLPVSFLVPLLCI